MQAPSGTHEHAELRRDDLDPDPITQFRLWFADAAAAQVPLANAIALATADAHGAPSVRHVLLRGVEDDGFSFFTNVESRKGRELAENPRGAFTVLWRELDRQINVRGEVGRLPEEASDAYFASRPREAQLGAWACGRASRCAAATSWSGGSPRPPHGSKAKRAATAFLGRVPRRPGDDRVLAGSAVPTA